MKFIPYIFFLLTTVCTLSRASIYSDVKDNVLNFLHLSRSLKNTDNAPAFEYKGNRKKNVLDAKTAQAKAKVVKKMRIHENNANEPSIYRMGNPDTSKHRYHMDPVLNILARRNYKKSRYESSSSVSSSSSMELQEWKDEWKEHWIQKKFEAINSSAPRGDSVNMLAARPWGVPCGDPNQHDMPWGTCMLPMECDAEYRIYRGDYFCGRTQFVCCALQQTTYDMYQGFDVSFADTSMETDSDEKEDERKGSKEQRRRKKQRNKRRRRRDRRKRKRQIKKDIKKIVREIKRILSRAYRNTTTMRKRKTKQLKRFVKNLKRKYREDRKSVKNLHELELIRIDDALGKKLQQIRGVNKDFMRNDTYREILINGTVSPAAVRMLVQAYPDLLPLLDKTRRYDFDDNSYDADID